MPQPVLRRPLFTRLHLAAIAGALALAFSAARAQPPALEPAATGGLPAVDRALARLSTHKRLLVIAAHPDDEDTSLIALVSRGLGGEAGYLSLSRGEGGQNLIGPELGVGLGILRSRELLAARSLDGGRQFFTRAYDFGYTLSLEEASKLWPKEMMVEDAVRVIRRFKPQVVVSIFPGVPSPTHGQHQMAGVTAFAAFAAASDPAAMPQLTQEGVAPWAPQLLYKSAFFDRDAPAVQLPTSGIDPVNGRSIFQLAMASRSMHRSQDMGQIQRLGPQETRVSWVQGGAGKDGKELFSGIDTSLAGIASTLANADSKRQVGDHLAYVQGVAEKARTALSAQKLGDAVASFADILSRLRSARAILAGGGFDDNERPVVELLDEKIDVAEAGLAAAAGIALDVSTAKETLVSGDTFTVNATLWNSGAEALSSVNVALLPSPDWARDPIVGELKEMTPGTLGTWELKPVVPAAKVSVPYYLEHPLQGSTYDWSIAPGDQRGEPFGPPPYMARFRFSVRGVSVTLDREVVHLHRDQAFGEVRRPLRVVPQIEVALAERLIVWPIQKGGAHTLHVTLTSHSATPLKGKVEAKIEANSANSAEGDKAIWPEVAAQPFAIADAEEPMDVALTLNAPKGLKAGSRTVKVSAVLEGGESFALAVPLVDYPHIRPTPLPQPAESRIQAADLVWPALKRVGYVRGASDRVPEALIQAGVPLDLLSAKDLADGDLKRFDALIIGSRAYEVDEALQKANHRLLDYVKGGGLMLVQYQQYPFVDGKYAPLPLEIARPHDRVTDETAPVTILEPQNQAFNAPNKIGADDWLGWIQERGLYFPHTWDAGYTPLLSMKDPDGPELKGSLLVAKVGKGTYVYSGLAFFRQLPAGVPGAYRLFANLMGLGRTAPAPAAGGKKK